MKNKKNSVDYLLILTAFFSLLGNEAFCSSSSSSSSSSIVQDDQNEKKNYAKYQGSLTGDEALKLLLAESQQNTEQKKPLCNRNTSLKIYSDEEIKEKNNKKKEVPVLIVKDEPVATLHTKASHDLRMALRFLGAKLGYRESLSDDKDDKDNDKYPNLILENGALDSLKGILESDKKSNLMMALLIAERTSRPKGKQRFEPGNADVYNSFIEEIFPHFSEFSVDCANNHIKDFFAPSFGEKSTFYTRDDIFGFEAIFKDYIIQN